MPQTKQRSSLFDSFTNLYSLSKTLRFELKPTPETHELLKKTNLQGKTPVQVDQEIDELYDKEMKPLFDELHEKFITESLNNLKLDNGQLEDLEKNYLELKRLNKEKKNNESEIKKLTDANTGKIPRLEKELRMLIVEQFNKLGEEWKAKYNDIKLDDKGFKILTNAKILQVLLILHPVKSEFIKKFKRFFTYFSGFNQNRENYYTDEDKATGVANRIIGKNLIIFFDNKQKFLEIVKEIPELVEYKKTFELDNYQNCLTQTDIEKHNEILNGLFLKSGEKQQGINEKVNLFCQQRNQDIQNNNKKMYLPHLTKLQKQIGCRTKQQRKLEESGKSIYPEYLEKVGLGFQIAKNEAGKYQIWEALEHIIKELEPKLKKLRENYQNFFSNWQQYKMDEIWFRKESINTISGRWFGDDNWEIIAKALAYLKTGRMEKGEYKIPPFVSLQDLKNAMEELEAGINFDIKKSKRRNNPETNITKETGKFSYTAKNLFKDDYKACFKTSLFETLLAVWQSEIDFKFKQIFDGYANKEGKTSPAFLKDFAEKSKEPFDKSKKDATGRSIHTEVVKNLIEEGYLRLFQLTKYHNLEKKGEVDVRATENRFYDVLNDFWEENPTVTYHKAFQATLTRKPYSEDKIKLNFENGTLARGWDINKETDNTAVILRDKKYYYLAIMDKKSKYCFDKEKNHQLFENIKDDWGKMEYKYLPDVSKMIPKCSTQLNNVINHFGSSNSDFELFDRKKFNKSLIISKKIFELNNIFYDKKYITKIIIIDNKNDKKRGVKLFQKEYLTISKNEAVYKNALHDWIKFCKDFLASYKSCDFFDYSSLKEVEKYDSLDKFYLDVDRLSYTKKFIPINSDELRNLQKNERIYLFKIYNKDFSENKKIKINGKDNLETLILKNLFSEQNLKKKIIKLNGQAEVFYRKDSIKKEKDINRSKTFDVIKNKRYTENKYFFHFPITINFGSSDSKYKEFNQDVLRGVKEDYEDIGIIGIDRGEKNLLYYSILDSNGKMIDQRSLNIINGVDYNAKLQERQDERNEARLNWEEIGNIKNFKEGYLSQAVSKIYELIIKHNAIVAMEDLNVEFKAKRMAKVEKSVYKKFELALARKLNHLILKDKKSDELGGVLNAYQLTPYIDAGKVGDFEKARQWGILFYVRANYTSTTDPLTGWRKHKYISNSEPDRKIQGFFRPDTGIQIDYDHDKKCFKFSYENEEKTWELFAFNGLQRFYWNNKDKKMQIHDLYEKFEDLFLNLDKSKNINNQIYHKDFRWRTLVFLWNLLNQIRNTDKSKTGSENDFLQSPVWSKKYRQFFDSRKVSKKDLPENGDANGAYNIARKGFMLLDRIAEDIEKPILFITDEQWDNAVADWNAYIAKRA